MLRFLLAPRRLALHAATLAAVAVCLWLGTWQLERAHDHARDPSSAPAVALEQLSRPFGALPTASVGRSVRAQGRWDAAHQVVVTGRHRGDRVGSWVVTPLVLDGARTRGRPDAIAVVRGWAPTDASDPGSLRPVRGVVRVQGVLEPSERSATGTPDIDGAAGTVAQLDTTTLAARWPYALHGGVLLQSAQRPVAASGLVAVSPPSSDRGNGAPFSNTGYAVQWLLFALFAVWMWWRLLREQWRDAGAVAGDDEVSGPRQPQPPKAVTVEGARHR